MPTFAYQAVDRAGKRTRGVANAASSNALTRTLEERGLLVLEVAEPSNGDATRSHWFKSSSRREVLEVTRALGSLLPVGMPLAQALNAASAVATGEVAAAVQDVRERVERGDTLSTALAQHPRFFTPLYVGLIRAGCIPLMALRAHRHTEVKHFITGSGATGYVIPDVLRDVNAVAERYGYITANMPWMEVAFRILLANGNQPLTVDEIAQQMTEHITYAGGSRTMSPESLARMLKKDDYYGFNVIQVP